MTSKLANYNMLGQEEQLLDGVAMTASVSCSAQEEYQVSEVELELSLNDDDEPTINQPIRG
jgi:hypothetical protein